MKLLKTLTAAVCLLAAAHAAEVPRPARDLVLTDTAGKPIHLRSYKGKVVLVQFLITNCIHCQATARLNSKLQADLGPEGLQVLGAAFNDEAVVSPEPIRGFMAEHAKFPVGAVLRDSVLSFLQVSVMTRLVVPQVVIIDRNGVIQAQSNPSEGSPELQTESYLREFLGKLLKSHS
ncbi:MAG TPA: TlpA disulfide reductase family protein [Bryobacteraceae bacterium]|jgi:peroxiredoxin